VLLKLPDLLQDVGVPAGEESAAFFVAGLLRWSLLVSAGGKNTPVPLATVPTLQPAQAIAGGCCCCDTKVHAHVQWNFKLAYATTQQVQGASVRPADNTGHITTNCEEDH
jgi:hypothetical protein